jgi:hypothetical protein
MKKFRSFLTTVILALVLLIAAIAMGSSPNIALIAAQPTSTIFDFDTGSPVVAEGQITPFTQTSGSVSASFSSPSDPAAFSIQSYSTTFFTLSQFSGKYIYSNNSSRDILDIKFNAELFSINFTFATIELQGGLIEQPSNILLTAYENTMLVGSTTAGGVFSNDSYPQGTLSYSSGQTINWVRISVPAQASGTTNFLVDNIVITFISESSPSPTLSPTPTPFPSVPELPSSLNYLLIIVVATLVILLVKMKLAKETR